MQHLSFPVMASHLTSIVNCLINLEFSELTVPVLALRQELHLKERRKRFLFFFFL